MTCHEPTMGVGKAVALVVDASLALQPPQDKEKAINKTVNMLECFIDKLDFLGYSN